MGLHQLRNYQFSEQRHNIVNRDCEEVALEFFFFEQIFLESFLYEHMLTTVKPEDKMIAK